jgi:hypothetical protein
MLCQPQTPRRAGESCSCLEGSSQKTAILPVAAPVKRLLRRKS